MKLCAGCVVVGFLLLVLPVAAQTAENVPARPLVPSLIQFSNVAADDSGYALTGKASIAFSIYDRQSGGEPLWTETQSNVQLDETGHYSVQLGITVPGGMPAALFASGESRWLGVGVDWQPEKPRVLLVSVPYAFKAGDAATIGGLPPSAFLRAEPETGTPLSAPAESTARSASPSSVPAGSGTSSYVPLWTRASVLGNSVLFQSGTGATAKLGIHTVSPATALDVNGTSTFRSTIKIFGDGNKLVAGNPGCGTGYAGLGFLPVANLDCTNYALLGGSKGDTYLNSGKTASIHFRSNDNELATIDNAGNLSVIGQNGGGGLNVAGNLTVGGAQNSGIAVKVQGNLLSAVLGDPGCGSGYAGIGFPTGSSLSGCTNYAVAGGPGGDTYVNSSGTATIHFRSNNNELATIDNDGNMKVTGQNGGGSLTVAGKVHSGNVSASIAASNITGPNGGGKCTGVFKASVSSCAIQGMTLTETTAGGPVLIMANIGGIYAQNCVFANFYLVMDGKIIESAAVNASGEDPGTSYTGSFSLTSVPLLSMQTPVAGSHTFQVQESDDQSNCSGKVEVLSPTIISVGSGTVASNPGSTRTLIVHEL